MLGDETRRKERMTVIQSRSDIAVRPPVEDCRQADCNDNNSYYLVRSVNRKAEIQEGSRGSELLDMKDHTHCSDSNNSIQATWRYPTWKKNAVKRYLAKRKVDRVHRSLGWGN